MLVIHENRGLNPHIEDIARRLALDNFVAFAPDALAPLGGYPGDEDKARDLFTKLDQAKTREDFVAAAKFLQAAPSARARSARSASATAAGSSNMLATRLPDLGAGVPFYGNQPPAAEVAKIKAPLLIHYAENDDRINAGWPAYEAALKAPTCRTACTSIPGTQHGFNNDTTPRYDAAAAKLAWSAPWSSSTRRFAGNYRQFRDRADEGASSVPSALPSYRRGARHCHRARPARNLHPRLLTRRISATLQ